MMTGGLVSFPQIVFVHRRVETIKPRVMVAVTLYISKMYIIYIIGIVVLLFMRAARINRLLD